MISAISLFPVPLVVPVSNGPLPGKLGSSKKQAFSAKLCEKLVLLGMLLVSSLLVLIKCNHVYNLKVFDRLLGELGNRK